MVPYDIPTNVTITATSCGQNSETAITFVQLAYVRCEDPLLSITDDSVIAMGYHNLSVNGTVVTFSCPPGLTLNGPESMICTHTGQWEPALSEVNCSEDVTVSSTIITDLPVTDGPSTTAVDSKQILGISLGVALFGVAIIILAIVVVVVVMVMRTKNKGAVHTNEPRYNMRTVHNDHPSHAPNNQDEKNKDALVYADIGQSHIQFRQQIPLLHIPHLDNNAAEYAKLNQHNNMLTPAAALEVESEVNDESDVNLDSLLIQLRPQVSPKWYEFGEAVGIKKEMLDNYASNCAPDDCIVEMLDYWLRNHVEKPTWKEVAEALKLIGLRKLALEIDNVYKTGKLPIEINVNEIPQDFAFTSDSHADSPPPIPPKTMDFSDNCSPGSRRHQPPFQTPVPPIPPKSARAMPTFHMDNTMEVPFSTDVPAIPPRPPKPY